MDSNTLSQLFNATLSQDQSIRTKVELTLKEYEIQDNFMNAVLTVICSENIDLGTRHAASIYFKNRIRRGWDTEKDAISENDKAFIKQNIIEALSKVPPVIRTQLTSSINIIICNDFPEKWPQLIPNLTALLSSNEYQHNYIGVLVLNEIVRIYQFKKDESEPLAQIVEHLYPLTLKIAQNAANTDTLEAAEIIKLIFKIYSASIQCDFFPCLQSEAYLVPWGTVFLQVVEKDIPDSVLPETKEEREKYPWWKAKKWAYKCLNRIFSRYGSPNSLKEYRQFAEGFTQNFAPIILKSYLKQTELLVNGRFMSSWVLHLIGDFYTECVKPKVTWQILKPQVEALTKYFIFPLMCFNNEEQELWEDDPVEYVRKRFDPMDDFKSPVASAAAFLVTLVKDRRSRTFMPILEFINNTIEANKQPQDMNSAFQKDGALAMIGILSDLTLRKNSPVKDQMGNFLLNLFDDFNSQFPFLRVRICELITKFENLELTDDQSKLALQGVMNCMQSDELPVKISASLALSSLLQYESIQAEIGPHIGVIMQELLKLLNEIDMDTLTPLMNKMVELFADQLAPYATQLCEQLKDTLLRMVTEANNENANEDDAGNKIMASMGILRTISTVVLAMEASPDILAQLEVTLYPVIHYILEKEIIDLYDDIFEIIDGFTYCQKRVSNVIWNAYGLIYNTFMNDAIDYIREMFPCLDNYVSFGSDVFKANKDYQNKMFEIIKTVMESDALDTTERIYGCQLMETMMLNCKGVIDEYIPEFITIVHKNIEDPEELPSGFLITCYEVIINAIYYNPLLTLSFLEHINYTSTFFTKWFASLDKFKRVHDKKLCIVALLTLLEMPFENVPKTLQDGWGQIMFALINLFQTYPKAVEERKKLEEDEENYEDAYEKLLNGDDGDEEYVEVEGDENVIDGDGEDYLQLLAAAAANEFGAFDSFEELEEELYFQTPLDDIDIYIKFQDIIQFISQNQLQSYGLLTQSLNPEQQAFLNHVMEIANHNRIQQTQTPANPQ
ncbi:ARM repeat-containing protein [Anaeromyces robustus]|uniref:ARM repeat-containing protein n=1 Tax=Anaeromyces robustus TaxID=1754192 RepID=A0A1Y1XCK4_9FUNG|nr:ARM repeat-containing protein [Anaeromyces robustus]|eukprot:ORX83104.1 ARM repeat-containing protein [Anaeromyces robustus]